VGSLHASTQRTGSEGAQIGGPCGRYVVLALGVVAISCAAVLVRLADAPPLVVAAFRMTIASLVLAPVGICRARAEMRSLLRDRWPLVLGAGGFLAIHFALWIASLSYTTVASSVVLVTSTPLFVAAVSRVLFGERLRRATFVGIGVSLAGAVLIGSTGMRAGGTASEGNVLALLAALAMAGYLLIGRRVRRGAGLLAYATLVFSSAALLLMLAVLLTGAPLGGYAAATYGAMVALALVPQLIGHTSLNWALRFLPATMVTVAVLGEPVGAAFLSWAALGETPAQMELIGGVLMLAGIALAFLRGGTSTSPVDEGSMRGV
jgi:drug/metabolite transporter (DMT)-like permease